jgi:hypothetical protein
MSRSLGFRVAVSLLVVAPVFAAGETAPELAADLVLRGGRVWTVDPSHPVAEAVAVRGDTIVSVGSTDSILAMIGPNTEVVDLGGKVVLPGFFDSHVHLQGAGAGLAQVQLKDARDEADFGNRLRDYAARLPPGRWVLGGDWDHDRALGGRLPTAELIDRYVPDRPVFINRYDGHMAVVNSQVLRRAGITAETPDPPGGVIVRKPGSREPTGLLRDTAQGLVGEHVPPPSDEEIEQALVGALAEARRVGVTSVEDMSGSSPRVQQRVMRLYQRLAREGRLTTRVHLRWPLARWQALADLGIEADFGNALLTVGGLKGFIDGSLGSSTAKMFQPYVHEPASTGVYVTPPEQIRQWAEAADRAGLAVAVHAIGDRGNAEVLDVFAEVARRNGPRDRRWRVEHAQHVRPEDYRRFHDLDVIASVQPYHLIDDGRWAEGRIGHERCASSYALRTFRDHGVRLAFGSDWPVAPLDPLAGIDAAVNRRTLDGKHPGGWFPDLKITVEEAVEAYTLGSAYASFDEDRLGSIQAGKLADLVVLSDDILDPHKRDTIGEATVVLTILGGRVVHRAP